MKSKSSTCFFTMALAVWLALVSYGVGFMWHYQGTPGLQGHPPSQWPEDSRIKSIPRLPTLVLAIHPHCPCSRATIGELAILMTHVQGLVNANVLFVKPQGFSEDWEKTDLWRSAASIPGVKVTTDESGVEARRFHSETSGEVVLYDADGQLLFSGGITAARGHSGDNAGRRAIVSLLTSNNSESKQTPVFGCPLFQKDSPKQPESSCHAIHN